MARRNNLAAALLVVGAGGLVQSGALDGVLKAEPEQGYMSRGNPWSKDYQPAVAGPATGPVSFRNCDAARAAGAAPVRIGDPGYAPHLDRDGDGVGCEPYLRR